MNESRPLPPLFEILPHRGRAALLDHVERHDETETVCVVEIGGSAWLHRADEGVPVWVGIEYMAQCIAAREGCIAHAEGRALAPGFLVRARRVRLDATIFQPGEVLRVRARRLRGRPGLRAMTYACEIHRGRDDDAAAIAEAEITVALGRELEPEAG
ncbi:MAG: 3-hydroxylacyl-ACP dehydratase [Deltaproteobacteria bacterium]|nr:3-hydroxylacyl-ACP dehydratase [Deltaproteobacteria bacterium]